MDIETFILIPLSVLEDYKKRFPLIINQHNNKVKTIYTIALPILLIFIGIGFGLNVPESLNFDLGLFIIPGLIFFFILAVLYIKFEDAIKVVLDEDIIVSYVILLKKKQITKKFMIDTPEQDFRERIYSLNNEI